VDGVIRQHLEIGRSKQVRHSGKDFKTHKLRQHRMVSKHWPTRPPEQLPRIQVRPTNRFWSTGAPAVDWRNRATMKPGASEIPVWAKGLD